MDKEMDLLRNSELRKRAALRLVDLIRNNNDKPLTIISKDGNEGYISKSSIGKMLSDKAVQKSVDNGFTREQHYNAVANIDHLFKNSIKVLSHPDSKARQNIEAIHRFATPLPNGNAAYITEREITKNGNKIYSVELIEMGKLEGYLPTESSSITALSRALDPATSSPITHNIHFFSGKST